MSEIVLPNGFTPRPYQREMMSYFDRGGTRAVMVWHRRAGKDLTMLHQTAKMAHQRIGTYWHLLPTQRQGRKIVWDGITGDGKRIIDHVFPPELRDGDPNSTDMKIKLKCGSVHQVVGSDGFDSLVGSNPVGVVFSEFSLSDPQSWNFVRPILRENGGWAAFIFTPRGYNHGYDIAEIAKKNKSWYFSCRTVDDTGIVSQADIQEERDSGMPESLIQQEYYCSFTSANIGSVLGSYIEDAEKQGRILDIECYDEAGGPVIGSLDLGFRDTTALWVWQIFPDRVALVDYREESGLDAQDWIESIKTMPYEWEGIYLPHDAAAKTFSTKYSAQEQFIESGLPTHILPRMRISDRINAARTILPQCVFANERVSRGLSALRAWSYTFDESRKMFSKDPLHDWSSHGSDSFTYGATVVAIHFKPKAIAAPKPEHEAAGGSYAFTLEDLHSDNDAAKNGRITERV